MYLVGIARVLKVTKKIEGKILEKKQIRKYRD